MSWFAKLDKDNIVEQMTFTNLQGEEGEIWCSKTFGGIWKETFENGRFRKRFAQVGHLYKSDTDEFIPIKPFSSWIWNEQTNSWTAPIEPPQDGKKYKWIEETQTWIESVPD